MRRQLLFICLLLCALMLSGWGAVLAAALCPHAATAGRAASVVESMSMEDDHACCPARDEGAAGASEHCSQASQEATHEMEAMASTARPTPQAVAWPAASCAHCIGRNGLPAAPAKAASDAAQKRQDAHRLTAQETKLVAPHALSFVSTISPTQGAPPGPAARKHLLLSVFLI